MPSGNGWDVPDDVRGDIEFRWWRVPANRILVLVFLSEKPLWYKGHYLNSGMAPCFGDGCKLCEKGIGSQLRFVMAAAEISSHRTGLLEVGNTVATEIRDLAMHNGGLRGLTVEISKHSFSKRSRMEVKCVGRSDDVWWQETDYPDIQTALYLGWQKQGYETPEIPKKVEPVTEVPRFRRPKVSIRA
jgi:hypothetical protein